VSTVVSILCVLHPPLLQQCQEVTVIQICPREGLVGCTPEAPSECQPLPPELRTKVRL